MIGGIAGAMAQQTGAIDQTTGLPMQQPVFPPSAQQAGQAMFGTQQPGSYDRVMPQAGATGPLNQNIDPSTARNMVSAAGNVNPMREAAKIASDVKELKNKDNPDAFTEKIINAKIKQGKAIYNSLTQEGKDISNEYLTGKRKLIK